MWENSLHLILYREPSPSSYYFPSPNIKADCQQSVSVTFRFFKHNTSGANYTINFSHGSTSVTAVHALTDYIKSRDFQDGPLFCWENRSPVSRSAFDKQLHHILSFCCLDGSKYYLKDTVFTLGRLPTYLKIITLMHKLGFVASGVALHLQCTYR